MKAVTLNASRLKFPREWKDTRALRHFCVECGIKTRRLAEAQENAAGAKRMTDMAGSRTHWCEAGGPPELLQHRPVNQAMLPELWPAMHDWCPIATGAGIFKSERSFATLTTASRWPGIVIASESKELSCESFA